MESMWGGGEWRAQKLAEESGDWLGGRLVSLSKFCLVVRCVLFQKLSNIVSYRPAIPHSTRTIMEHNLIKWCH